MFLLMPVKALPVRTYTCHGWVLVPEGARDAVARIARIVARSTNVGKKARIDRLEAIASSTGLL
jgi:hypothetical protein